MNIDINYQYQYHAVSPYHMSIAYSKVSSPEKAISFNFNIILEVALGMVTSKLQTHRAGIIIFFYSQNVNFTKF